MKVQYSEDFIIEDLGVQEFDVYDIEVEDNHNFFGNDILLHNSNLYDLKKLADPNKTTKENYDYINKYLNENLDPFIVDHFAHLAEISNTRDVPVKMDREIISDRTFMASKKRYYWRIIEKDYAYLAKPEYKLKGLSPVRSDIPIYVKKQLKHVLRTWIDNADNPKHAEALLTEITRETYKEFPTLPMNQIGRPMSIGEKFNGKTLNDSPLASQFKASLIYNNWLRESGLDKEFELITCGVKVKLYTLKDPTTNVFKHHVIAVPEEHPEVIWKYINLDYETMIQKTYRSLYDEVTLKNGIKKDSRTVDLFEM